MSVSTDLFHHPHRARLSLRPRPLGNRHTRGTHHSPCAQTNMAELNCPTLYFSCALVLLGNAGVTGMDWASGEAGQTPLGKPQQMHKVQ
jgi:hypothetical protein